jgi:tetratricopeptide (TPR) repeat protein
LKKTHYIPQALVIITAVALCYRSVPGSPFQFDDFPSIVRNEAIRDVSNIGALWNCNPARFLVFLSLSVNYYLGGLDTYGYHLFNIAVHIFNSILVMIFGAALVAAWRGGEPQWPWSWLSFFSAIIFAVHPLQTQAVTYIWQRNASMVAFFYLSAMTLYLSAAVAGKEPGRPARLRYVGAVICAICAMFTKQTAVTLPIALAMLEFFFINPAGDRERIRRLAPFFGLMLIIPILAFMGITRELEDIALLGEKAPSHRDYFLTQLNVIVTYIRLIAFPVNQNLDYDYPIAHFISDSIVSACVLSGFVALALAFYRRDRIISFGVLFFFLALSVESSVFPLGDVIFEHRVYLPSVGAIIAFWAGLFYTLDKLAPGWFKKKPAAIAMTLALVALASGYAAATINRNEVWRNGETLWTDAAKKSPGKLRPIHNLGVEAHTMGDYDRAEKLFLQALLINPKCAEILYNMAMINLRRNELDAALKYLDEAITIDPFIRFPLFSLGEACLKRGRTAEAVKCYRLAVKLKPGMPKGWRGLAQALAAAGDKDGAADVARDVLRRWPEAEKDVLIKTLSSRAPSKTQ